MHQPTYPTYGRLKFRERTQVERRLGRIDAIKGGEARNKGVRKNEFDVRRAAAVANLLDVARALGAG